MWTLEQVRAEYHRLDRLLGIDTSGIPVRFSKRVTRQYGVCTFLKNRPQEIRLADFLRQEDAVFWDTARHEYAHAAAALLTGKRHGHDEVWRAVCRRIGCPEDRLAPQCAAAEENRKRIAAARGVYVDTCGAARWCRRWRKNGARSAAAGAAGRNSGWKSDTNRRSTNNDTSRTGKRSVF